MLFWVLCITTLMHANANNIPEDSLQRFREVFFDIVSKHSSHQYEMLEEVIEPVEEMMEECREDVTREMDECRSSLTETMCTQETIDKINAYLENMDTALYPVLSFFSTPQWEELQTYLEGIDEEISEFSRIGEWTDHNKLPIPARQDQRSTVPLQGRSRPALDEPNNILSLLSRQRRNFVDQGIKQQMYATLEDDVKMCFNQFAECSAFLYAAPMVLTKVCGAENLKEIVAVTGVFANIQAMHEANGDPSTSPILLKVEYNPDSGNPETFSYDEVYVTAITPKGEQKYQSKYEYNAEFPEVSAKMLAIELLGKWGFKNLSVALFEKYFNTNPLEENFNKNIF